MRIRLEGFRKHRYIERHGADLSRRRPRYAEPSDREFRFGKTCKTH
jgi:hypothetical protein